MLNNDVMRSVRFMLDLSDAKLVDLIALAGHQVEKSAVHAYLKKDDDADYVECDDITMGHFLDGLVYFRRGKDETRPAQPLELPVTNNLVLKKLRVAFELKDDDIYAMLADAGFEVSKPELSALFRKKDHKHFRSCGDQFLRNFLKGLTLRVRKN